LWVIAEWPQTISNIILKFYLHLPEANMERKPCERTRDALLDLPSVCLSWSFVVDVMLCSNVGNAIFDKGYIKCSRGPHLARMPQVPHPWFTYFPLVFLLLLNIQTFADLSPKWTAAMK